MRGASRLKVVWWLAPLVPAIALAQSAPPYGTGALGPAPVPGTSSPSNTDSTGSSTSVVPGTNRTPSGIPDPTLAPGPPGSINLGAPGLGRYSTPGGGSAVTPGNPLGGTVSGPTVPGGPTMPGNTPGGITNPNPSIGGMNNTAGTSIGGVPSMGSPSYAPTSPGLGAPGGPTGPVAPITPINPVTPLSPGGFSSPAPGGSMPGGNRPQ